MPQDQNPTARLGAIIAAIEAELTFLQQRRAVLSIDGVDVTAEWVARCRGRLCEVHTMLETEALTRPSADPRPDPARSTQ